MGKFLYMNPSLQEAEKEFDSTKPFLAPATPTSHFLAHPLQPTKRTPSKRLWRQTARPPSSDSYEQLRLSTAADQADETATATDCLPAVDK